MMNAISCMSWIRRGVSKAEPDRIKLDDDQLSKLVTENQESDETESTDPEENDDSDTTGSDISKKYNLEKYDEGDADDTDDDDSESDSDENDLEENDSDDFPTKSSTSKSGLKMAGMSYYGSNKQDPYMSKDVQSSDEEAEILPDDNLLAIGKASGDFCGLEVYVYNEASSSLYCHHDTILGSFPLAMEWVGYDPGEVGPGNLLAIGSMEPHIELWDLDVVDTLEAAFVLKGSHKKKGKKKLKVSRGGHTDAVLDLAWNSLQTQVLASGSADFTIGLWDLNEGSMVTTMRHHSEKVQALQWHPFEHQTLLSGSFDKTVRVYDCRSCDSAHKSWTLPGEVERVTWNRHDPYYFLASTESGHVSCLDVRSTKPLFTMKAHESAVSGLALSSELPGCLLTASSDKLVKVWDIRRKEPEMIHSKDYKVGEVMCLLPCPDSGCVFAVGGERELRVIHLKTAEGVAEIFEQTQSAEAFEGIKIKSANNSMSKKQKTRKLLSGDSDSSKSETSSEEEMEKVTKVKKKKKKKGQHSESTTVEKSAVKKGKTILEDTADRNIKSSLPKRKKLKKKKKAALL